MIELLLLTVIAALPVSPIAAVIAGLVVAAVIAGVSVFLFRSSGKKAKGGKASPTTGANDWQPQAQPGTAGGWNSQGAPADNMWSQQQGSSWGQQAQQPGNWGAPAQQQAGGWGTPTASQQPGSSWGAQNPSQPSATAWGAQANAQQQQAGGWGQTAQGAAGSAQQPAWGAQNAAQQQSAANPWGGGPSAQPANPWASQSAQSPWDTPGAPPTQDSWGQQPSSAQPGTAWGGAPSSQGQQAPTAYGPGSGQSWGQSSASSGQGPADPWSSAAQQQYPGMGVQAAPAGSPSAPSWQQSGGFGPSSADADKTILRSTGPQAPGTLGVVRVEEGKEPGRVYEIRKDVLSIGRSRDSDIFLEDLAVSRLHASIVNMGNGNYALKDEGSANGTKVNGQLAVKYQPHPLQEGDRIQLGQTVLVFGKR